MFDDVLSLLKSNGDFFSSIPKARTAKIVRNILNIVDTIPDSLDVQIGLCKDVIEWCKVEKRTFLKQRIEAKVANFLSYFLFIYSNADLFYLIFDILIYGFIKLANLFLTRKDTTDALTLINSLLKELKKLDDKQMLTECHLTEARIYHSLQNIPKGCYLYQ